MRKHRRHGKHPKGGKDKLDKLDKLNKGLCPEEFEICVPMDCKLLGEWDTRCKWEKHLKKLTPDGMLPKDYEKSTCHGQGCGCGKKGYKLKPGAAPGQETKEPPTECYDCYSCDCKPGWTLRGELAIAHAALVHDKIHRQALSLEQVSAVDVGFAIWEREGRFGEFLAIRVHVNRKRSPEQLARLGLGSLTRTAFAFATAPGFLAGGSGGGKDDLRLYGFRHPRPSGHGRAADGCGGDLDPKCPHPERWFQLMELLEREIEEDVDFWKGVGRYPISGVSRDDLSIFCPRPIEEPRTLGDIRLCICGVPIDIVNADYNPTVTHPGGDADRGVFSDPPDQSNRLEDDEMLLIGRGRVNPLVGGVSVGSITGQAGTLGTIVWDQTDGTPCVLSNWHVLAGTATAQVGQPTYQPALFDGGTEDDVVARLKRWHLGEEGDAAIAELTGDRYYASGEVLGLWHPISGYLEPKLNMEVRKWGRTTGFTQGFIDGIHLATNIDYGNGVVRYFRNQFHIAPLFRGDDLSQVGDSGSLVVTSFKPVELDEDLSTLYGWLQDWECSQKRAKLCGEIEESLPKLKKECEGLDCKISHGLSDDCRKSLEKCKKDLKACKKTPEECRRIFEYCVKKLGDCIDFPADCRQQLVAECISEFAECKKSYKKCIDGFESCLGDACRIFELDLSQCDKSDGLCADLEKKRCQLSLVFRGIGCRALCLVYLKQKLTQLYEQCCDCRLTSGEISRELDEIAENLGEKCAGIKDAFEKWRSCCLEGGDPKEFQEDGGPKEGHEDGDPEKNKDDYPVCSCATVACLLKVVKLGCESAEKRLEFFGRAAEMFERWKVACFKIEESKERFTQIYAIFEKKCDVSAYKDPSEFVDCVKKHLEEKFEKTKAEQRKKRRERRREPTNLGAGTADEEGSGRIDPDDVLEALEHLLEYRSEELLGALRASKSKFRDRRQDDQDRDATRAYYAVGILFAGDTPGSPFGEFAVASEISRVAEELRFSLRPIFEPRSSFRELRERPPRQGGRGARALRSRSSLTPGEQSADPRPGGPQPDIERSQPDTGSGG
jgi:hypothetical protein